MYERYNLKVVTTQPPCAVGTVTEYDGLAYMMVGFAVTQRALGGMALQIDADYAATISLATNKVDGVVQLDMDIDATSEAKYAWVIVPGGTPVKNFWVNGLASTAGSTPTSVTDWTNSGLTPAGKVSNGEWANGSLKATAMPTALGTATSGGDYSATINAIMTNVTNLRAAGMRGVGALSAFSATATPAEAAGLFVPKKVYYSTGANVCAFSASSVSDSATPVSADWQTGDILVYKGEARVVISATTAGASTAGGILINSGLTASSSGVLDNTYLRIGKYRVKAIWDK